MPAVQKPTGSSATRLAPTHSTIEVSACGREPRSDASITLAGVTRMASSLYASSFRGARSRVHWMPRLRPARSRLRVGHSVWW